MEGREDQKAPDRLRELEEEEEEEKGKKKSSFPGLDMKIDRPLGELDPVRFKRELRRWACAVVRYARRLSRSRSRSRSRRSSVSSFRFEEDEDFGGSA